MYLTNFKLQKSKDKPLRKVIPTSIQQKAEGSKEMSENSRIPEEPTLENIASQFDNVATTDQPQKSVRAKGSWQGPNRSCPGH